MQLIRRSLFHVFCKQSPVSVFLRLLCFLILKGFLRLFFFFFFCYYGCLFFSFLGFCHKWNTSQKRNGSQSVIIVKFCKCPLEQSVDELQHLKFFYLKNKAFRPPRIYPKCLVLTIMLPNMLSCLFCLLYMLDILREL